jgi:transglutaminase-like putative cysteine protease
MELIACEKAFALSDNDVKEFLGQALLASPAALDVANAHAIRYTLEPKAGTLSIPATDNQTVVQSGNRTIVTVRPVVPPAGEAYPYRGADKALIAATKPTAYLQSDDPKVAALAREATAGAKDAAQAIRQIAKFVDQHVESKSLSVGYATAAEVAETRSGDCSEHAVLAAAMCRAVGIPAEVVAGVVYVDEFGGRQHVFGPHAWARAYVGGKWIGLDGTGRDYGPGHIALAVSQDGSPAGFFQMLGSLGNFTIVKAEPIR